MNGRRASGWYARLESEVAALGGMYNAHLHLDRAGTWEPAYWSADVEQSLRSAHSSLHDKHRLIHRIHAGPAYTRDDFNRRVNAALDVMVACNTAVAETLVDVTADEVGLTALDWMLDIKSRRADEIDLRIGAYSPFGFTDAEPGRWELFVAGARRADLIGCLPEADDTREYPDHIGFAEHCRRTLTLARELGIPAQVHVDQRFEPSETGTEDLLEVLRELGPGVDPEGEPMVWAVHAVSPATYDDARFERVVAGMLECNVGLITCPSAALGMRMYRPVQGPTGNCIPRVLELLAAGVQVRMGSDNIDDIASPSTTADLYDEVFTLSAAIRFYDPEILARVAAGVALTDGQRARVGAHLAENSAAVQRFLAGHHTAEPDVSG